MKNLKNWLELTVLAAILASCGPSIYDLPVAPPKDEWVDSQDAIEEDEEVRIRRFLDSKRVAITVYGALQSKDWGKALDQMSQETQNFLENGAGDGVAATALESGVLKLNGKEEPFDVVGDFFVSNLEDIVDELEGQSENETTKRKELYALSRDGQARKIIFIYEAGAWKFHSPFIRTALIER